MTTVKFKIAQPLIFIRCERKNWNVKVEITQSECG